MFDNLITYIEAFYQAIDGSAKLQAIDCRSIRKTDMRGRSELHLYDILQPRYLRLFHHHQGKRRERGKDRVQEHVRRGEFQQSGPCYHHGERSRVLW